MTRSFSLRQNLENLGRYARRAAFVIAPKRYGDTAVMRARFNDAVFISPGRGYLFASNEKVANSTLRATFQTLEAGGATPVHYKPFKRWTGPLAQPSDVGDIEAALRGPGIHRFCVVRDPYARLVSCYRNKLEAGSRGRGFARMMRQLGLDPRRDDIDFARFIESLPGQKQAAMNPHWRIQYYNVFADMIAYDEIIRYEAFGAALARLIARFYPEAPPAPVISENRHAENSDALVADYFTPALKEIVREVYALDFKTFGYAP